VIADSDRVTLQEIEEHHIMRRTHCHAILAAALLVAAAFAAPLLAQEPLLPPPGQPGVEGIAPLQPVPVAQPLPVAQPTIAQPVIRPGGTTLEPVPVVISTREPVLADQRARGSAPTNVSVSAVSPVAVTVTWVLPPCAAGSLIRVGIPGGASRIFYQSDTLAVSRTCQLSPRASKQLRVAGGATPTVQRMEPLQPATTYVVSVAAFYRDSASGGAAPVNVTMPPPPAFTIAPVTPTATAVALSWNETLRPSRYVVYRDNAALADAGLNTSYQDTSVKPAVAYAYRVDAVYEAVYTGQAYKAVPDVIVSATATATTANQVVVGFADTHTHPFANLASGGRLFWGAAFGPIDAALAICEAWHGLGGLSDVIGNIKRTLGGNVSVGHHTGGYPNFDGWPAHNTLDHQQMYADWIFRAYQGGLRLMVSHAVNNGLVCSIAAKAPGRTCDDMEAADLQIQAAKDMEAYIDVESGGKGRGWFRIAYSPQEARQIIQSGKLAVVLGIEVDKLFGCGKNQCDAATVDAQLDKYYGLGVRHLIPVHFADNAFGGYALGGGTEKILFGVNSMAANEGGLTSFEEPKEEGCSPTFAQQCNQRTLTALGGQLITSMMNRGMIIDIDHMGMKTTDSVLVLTSARHYPVIGGHTGFVATAMPGKSSERDKSDAWLMTMKEYGGMVSVGLSPSETPAYQSSWSAQVPNDCPETSKSWAQSYLYAVDKMGGPDTAAVGLATDQFLNDMLGPRFDGHCPTQNGRVAYPFTTRTGVKLDKSVAGKREFDYNNEGLAHFGLLADFVQDLKNVGLTNRDLEPLFRSAEGYIRLWERSVAAMPVP
jgi:microsomal dipeptidase-like Zn-dependent dipeptidase